MAEVANDAELLKEKANKYFKGNPEELTGLWLVSAAQIRSLTGHWSDRQLGLTSFYEKQSESLMSLKANASRAPFILTAFG